MSDDLLPAFVEEARELVDSAGQALLALRRAPGEAAALEALFRAVHTLKGSAGLIGFAPMGQAFHAAEDRLSEIRRGARALDAALLEALLAALDQAALWVEAIAAHGELPTDADAAELVARLTCDAGAASVEPARSAGWAEELRQGAPGAAGTLVAFRYAPAAEAYFRGDDPLAIVRGVPDLAHLRIQPRSLFGELKDYDTFACNLVITGLSRAPLPTVRAAFRLVPDEVELAETREPAETPAVPLTAADGAGRTLRVEASRLDALAAAADDLVVAKNALAHLVAQACAAAPPALSRSLAAAQADVDRRLTRLHDGVGRMRLVPLAGLFRRFPPILRQAAASLGKSVELVLDGETVEVDKAIADGLYEPLLHLLRNAVDHGVEPTADRRAAGKPVPAGVRLSALPLGDEVVIEVADDGRGLDLQRVRAIAGERGLASAEALAAMSDAVAAELIFRPGFSTASAVTDLSGRGVGLDAVRARVASLGGGVQAQSVPGAGTRFVIRLPVRVRLARLMMVQAGGETYGVPLESVVEAIRVAAARLTPVRAGQALVWRDRALPLLSLAELLQMPEPPAAEELKVIIVRAGEELAAVSVEGFGERLQTPVRPLSGVLARVPGLRGSSLLGDGRVLMVLDVPELIG